MPIIKGVHNADNPFVMVHNAFINDEQLSWKAKGILVYLLSKPDGWTVRVNDLAKRSRDGRDSILSGLRELIKYGYATYERPRSEKGEFESGGYTVYEVSIKTVPQPDPESLPKPEPESKHPQTDNPVMGITPEPQQENPYTDNPTHSNTEVSNIDNKANALLLPESGKEKLLFEKFNEQRQAAGRRRCLKFPNLAVKERFLEVANKRSAAQLECAIRCAFHAGVGSLPKLVAYVENWSPNGAKAYNSRASASTIQQRSIAAVQSIIQEVQNGDT